MIFNNLNRLHKYIETNSILKKAIYLYVNKQKYVLSILIFCYAFLSIQVLTSIKEPSFESINFDTNINYSSVIIIVILFILSILQILCIVNLNIKYENEKDNLRKNRDKNSRYLVREYCNQEFYFKVLKFLGGVHYEVMKDDFDIFYENQEGKMIAVEFKQFSVINKKILWPTANKDNYLVSLKNRILNNNKKIDFYYLIVNTSFFELDMSKNKPEFVEKK